MLDVVKQFFCIYGDDQMIFVFASLYMACYIYRLAYVEPSLNFRDKVSLVILPESPSYPVATLSR